jgi:hypothetical protein
MTIGLIVYKSHQIDIKIINQAYYNPDVGGQHIGKTEILARKHFGKWL